MCQNSQTRKNIYDITNQVVEICQNILNQVLYFDAIAPAEEIPNHLLLLYLTTGKCFSKLMIKEGYKIQQILPIIFYCSTSQQVICYLKFRKPFEESKIKTN